MCQGILICFEVQDSQPVPLWYRLSVCRILKYWIHVSLQAFSVQEAFWACFWSRISIEDAIWCLELEALAYGRSAENVQQLALTYWTCNSRFRTQLSPPLQRVASQSHTFNNIWSRIKNREPWLGVKTDRHSGR